MSPDPLAEELICEHDVPIADFCPLCAGYENVDTSPKTDEELPEGWEDEVPKTDSVIVLARAYAASANAPAVVKNYIPTLLMGLGAKIATVKNRSLSTTGSCYDYYQPEVPYRYISHTLLLGPSGGGKGVLADFFHILIQGMWTWEQYSGGTVQGLRGTDRLDKGGKVIHEPGALEHNSHGFVNVPEFSITVGLDKAGGSPGQMQTLISWMDTGDMAYRLGTTGYHGYHSEASIIGHLQTSRINSVEDALLGLNRRALYEVIPPTTILEDVKEVNRVATSGSQSILLATRTRIAAVENDFAPTSVNWEEPRAFLEDFVRRKKATKEDKQLVFSICMGYHLMSGGNLTGGIAIHLDKTLLATLNRLITHKHATRIEPYIRGSQEAMRVCRDVDVMGNGQEIKKNELARIISRRMAVSHTMAFRYIDHLLKEEGLLEDRGEVIGARGRPSRLIGLTPGGQ